MRGWLYYGTKHLQVVPFMPGTPVYVDDMLPYIYKRLRSEEKISRMFCGDDKNLNQFIAYFERIKTAQILCTVADRNDANTLRPVGLSWVDNAKGEDGCRSAMPGEVFFNGTARISRSLAKLGLGYMFEEFKIDVMHGIQCVSNYPARNFALRLGFKEVAIVPDAHVVNGKFEDGRILILKAKDFLPRFHAWHEAFDLKDEEPIPVERNPIIA